MPTASFCLILSAYNSARNKLKNARDRLNNALQIGYGRFSGEEGRRDIKFLTDILLSDIYVLKLHGLVELDLSNTEVTVIGKNAMKGCKKLKQLSLPMTLEKIGSSAFAKSGLVELDLSNTVVTEIGVRAMKDCKELKRVSLPKTLNKIGNSAFEGSGLKELDISHTQVDAVGLKKKLPKNCKIVK